MKGLSVAALCFFLLSLSLAVNENKKKEEVSDDKKKEVDPKYKKTISHIKEEDLAKLHPYLLVVSLVPTDEDEAAVGSGKESKNYTAWLTKMSQKLKDAYMLANMDNKSPDEEPVVEIVQVDLRKFKDSNNLRLAFYVSWPTNGEIPSKKSADVYEKLEKEEMWKVINRRVLFYPKPVETETDKTSRTLSIIAFVMGWMCLAALVVVVAYLGIKYRDGIKSLARRIEQWSNPNRSGYSNLGGETVHDWRSDPTSATEPIPYNAPEDTKPKKKLRPPGGLLTDVDDGETTDFVTSKNKSYGTYEEDTGTEMISEPSKDITQIRLSDLATKEHITKDVKEGEQTPPLTPKSMQKHLIKKYQDKQAEEQVRVVDDLTASNSEVFPDDFADCVEEEEIFQIKP